MKRLFFKFALLYCMLGSVAQAQVFTASVTQDTVYSCAGPGGGFVQLGVTASGGTPPYYYTWSPTFGLDNPYGPTPMAWFAGPLLMYEVTVTDNAGASITDSVFIKDTWIPGFGIGPDIVACADDTVVLSAGTNMPPGTYVYLWNTGATTPTINISATGIYSVELLDTLGCTHRDTAVVTILPTPSVDLGPDQVLCGGDSLFLDCGPGFPTVYTWNSGAINCGTYINQAGTYWLDLTDANGCTGTDTLEVFIQSAPIDLGGPDTTFCQSGVLGTAAIPPGLTYLWSTNETSEFITVNQTGPYWVEITDVGTGCYFYDSIYVYIDSAMPTPLFMDSTAECELIYFNNKSTFSHLETTSFEWQFQHILLPNSYEKDPPPQIYPNTGTYLPCLIIENTCGKDTAYNSVTIYPLCVWPGDANNDGIANNLDVLSIGQAYNFSGPGRSNASLDWVGQPADNWPSTPTGEIDYAYRDCNGNGAIDHYDTLAIFVNYGLTHNKGASGGADDPLLYLDMAALSGPVGVGDTVSLPIMLGVDTLPVNDLYGIAFTLNYDTALVDSGTASINALNSWMGTNLLKMHKDFPNNGVIDAAFSRTDQMEISGFGMVGKFTFVMVDDIAKRAETDTLMLSFENIQLQRLDGSVIPAQGGSAEIVVNEETTSIAPTLDWPIRVYPNPANESVSLSLPAQKGTEISLMTVEGKVLAQWPVSQGELNIDTSELPVGLYLLQIRARDGRQAHQKLLIAR